MSAKKSFVLFLRIVLVLYSLQFTKDAFFKWDGFSFYMRFTDFLPELSLAFILWIVLSAIITVVIWLIAYGIVKIIPKSSINIDYVIGWIIVCVIIKKSIDFFIAKFLFNFISFSNLSLWIIGGVLAIVTVWFARKYVERVLFEVNLRLTPLVWLFAFLLVIAIPLSALNIKFHEGKNMSAESTQGTSLDKKRPNIILVIMDALAAVDMQTYGYNRSTTPFITEWAKDAVLFKNAYASANWTTPAVMSIMTGQRPWTHRVWFQVYFHPARNYENNLPGIMRDYGYAVYSFVQNSHAHPENLGIKDAFLIKNKAHTFYLSTGWWYDKLVEFFINRPIVEKWIFSEYRHIVNRLLEFLRPASYATYSTLVPPENVYNRFLEYISKNHNSEQPFFAWLHVFPPHDPYLPPKPYMGMFGDAEKFNNEKEQGKAGLSGEYKSEKQKEVDILRKRYDEFILYSDQQFKLFLSRLDETIDVSNTVIVLLSDHGESFSHGYQGHGGKYFYESVIHVPLIIKLPWKIKGKVIDMPVEHIDIPPTILELAGIPVPEWMEGRSLDPLFEGNFIEPKPLFSMQLIKNRVIGNPPISKGVIAVIDGDYKLIYNLEDKNSLLFDLSSDPDGTIDISKEKPDIVQSLVRLIDNNLANVNGKNARITQSVEK